MKKIFSIVTLVMMFLSGAFAQDSFEYKVHRAGPDGFNLASVLITGKKDAVLIDAHFKKSDAHRVIAQILESGKELKTIYVSHGDPDYYFGLTVLKQAFPKAEVYATAQTIKHIEKTYMKKLNFWGPKLGVNGDNYIVLPKVLKSDTLKLEGKDIKIIGLDSKSPERSYVYVPSMKAIFGGVNIVVNEHLWMADAPTKDARAKWLEVLNNMDNLDVKTVVASHAGKNSKEDKSAIEFAKQYLKTYDKAAKKAKNSKELIKIMQEAYPNLDKESFSLSLGAKVSKGEMKW